MAGRRPGFPGIGESEATGQCAKVLFKAKPHVFRNPNMSSIGAIEDADVAAAAEHNPGEDDAAGFSESLADDGSPRSRHVDRGGVQVRETSPFDSQDGAARYALKGANRDSIERNREFGGLIYMRRDANGNNTYVRLHRTSFRQQPRGGEARRPRNRLSSTTLLAGYYHTHGAYPSETPTGQLSQLVNLMQAYLKVIAFRVAISNSRETSPARHGSADVVRSIVRHGTPAIRALLGIASRNEPGTAVAATGAPAAGARPAGARLWAIHRGLQDSRPDDGQESSGAAC